MCLSTGALIFYLFILGLIFIVLPALVVYALVLVFGREKLPYNLP